MYPATYCSKCQTEIEKQKAEYLNKRKKSSNSKYNVKREKKYIQFYNSLDWKRLSLQYMIDKGYRCEGDGCHNIATEVHHIIPIQTSEGWERRLDYTNLKALCIRCHNKAHNRFIKRAGVVQKVL